MFSKLKTAGALVISAAIAVAAPAADSDAKKNAPAPAAQNNQAPRPAAQKSPAAQQQKAAQQAAAQRAAQQQAAVKARAAKKKQPRESLIDKLGLTPEQRSQVAAIHQRAKSELKALQNDFKAKRAAFVELKKANDPSAEKAKIAFRAAQDRLKSQRQAFKAEVLAVLTPEQRAKYDALRAERFGTARAAAAPKRPSR